ncbi:MAG TPA: hypothetical protein VGM88_34770 [Kofleriaceae bacterium]|jgi:hypothetical protein
MLQFLVTSKVRRRLLVLLWGQQQRGSVAELAALADASFAGAHGELRAMQRLQLVRAERTGGKEVFSAALDHPEAELLARLAETDVPKRPAASSRDAQLKQQLVALGSPLRGVAPADVAPADVLGVLAAGCALARRDAVVARTLPLCFWRQRDHLDARSLLSLAATPEEKHAVAFFLDLTSQLGGDRRLVGLAEILRDQRLTQRRPFFFGRASPPRDFPLAAKWGFDMNMDLDAFRTLFAKFAKFPLSPDLKNSPQR